MYHLNFLVSIHRNENISVSVCCLLFAGMYQHISKCCVDTICKTQHLTQHTEVVRKLQGYSELMKWIFIFLIFFFADLEVSRPADFKYFHCFGGAASDKSVVSRTTEP